MAGSDLRSMFSAMRKRQSEEPPARETKQLKKICTATDDLPGTSFQIEDDESSLDGDNRDASEEDLSDEEPFGPFIEREEYHKPPGPDDISQTPSDGPTQPKISYPARHQDHKRAFQAAWYQVHPWLEYSQSSDAAFCFACRHFLGQNIHAEETFTSGGFSNWKKAQGKKGKFAKHRAADYHVNAMVTWSSFKASQKIGSVQQLLSDQHKKEVRENRHFIKTVSEILLVTGVQNIAQRGHREDATSDNVGNLKRLLRLVSGHDDIIRKRLKDGPRNAKYTSPEIQNEMLATLALMVRDEILAEMLEAEQFSILVDETKDVRKTEQLSLVGRYFHGGKIKESFLCFKDTDGLDAASLCETIIQLLGGYGLDYRKNLVGQGYDGAAVMSGALSGVAKRVKEIAPSAEYVHCYAHRLNLVIVDACKSVIEAGHFFALLQQLYVYMSGSYIHQKWLEIQREMFPGEQARELKRLSDTRWACRADACHVLQARLPAVLRLLHLLSEGRGERAVDARGLLAQLDENFVARLVLMTALLQKTKSLSSMFQRDDQDLSAASNLSAVVIQQLQVMRTSEEGLDEIWDTVTHLIEDCKDDITPPRTRRATRPSRHMDDYHVLEATGQRDQATTKADFKINFVFPVLDRMLQELQRRFSDKNQGLMKGIDALTPTSENFLDLESLKVIQETYKITLEDLKHEVHQVKRLIERKSTKGEMVPTTMQGFLIFLEPYQDAFFELYRLTKIAAVIPVTSASCERSFSAMKLIKTYLRNSMGHDRLSDLGMLSIEKVRAEGLNMELFVEKFASAHNNRRIKLV